MSSAGPRIDALKQALSNFWNDRNQRERNMLSIAGVVIALGLFYTLLIDPALSGRADLTKKLPAMRQQAAEAQSLAKEATAAGAKTGGGAPPAPMTKEGLDTSLARKGMKAQSVAVTGELAKVQLNGASFSSTVDWLSELQKSMRISVADARFEAQAQTDIVNATLTLRQQRQADGAQ